MNMKTLTFALAATLCSASPAASQVMAYGPGGPAPAMKEAAAAFERETGQRVVVTAGPTDQWLPRATTDADLIFSGAETMMTAFERAFAGQIDTATIRPLYLRAGAILVRPGNPSGVSGLRDLARPGHRILVVEGAGQNGLWEDMAGRTGDIDLVRAIRRNIVGFAKSSADAKETWTSDRSIDAWIIWTIWQKANPTISQAVPVERDLVVYRDVGIGLTKRGKSDPAARRFADWLASGRADGIFRRWGWIVPEKKGEK
jgi:accessory colonization factor AcfC